MDISLQVNTEGGTLVVRLFKDRSCTDSYKTFACTVSCRGCEYRSDIPASELQALLQAVRSATISAVGGCAMGLDGTSYELTIEDGVAHATYRWWMIPDDGWQPLAQISGMLLHLGFKVSGQYLP